MPVRVVHGANEGHWSLAGRTIAEARSLLKDICNLSADLLAWVNGIACGDSTILQEGDNLEFGKEFGQKGGIQDFVSESEVRQMYGDDGFERLKDAGLKASMQPVYSGLEVMGFGRSLNNDAPPARPIPLSVDVKSETVIFNGTTYNCDRSIALVLKCLIDARGEIRSTGDIKRASPDEPWEERLDLTIQRKLIPHHSGVGSLIEPVSKRGYRLRIEAFE